MFSTVVTNRRRFNAWSCKDLAISDEDTNKKTEEDIRRAAEKWLYEYMVKKHERDPDGDVPCPLIQHEAQGYK